MNPVRPGPAASGPLQKRRHDRYTVETPGLLRLQETRGGIYAITVLDVSKSGLRINCPSAVLSDSRVEVKVHGSTIVGTVRYARSVGYEFHVGIEAELLQTAAGATSGEELDLTLLFPADAIRLRRA